MNRGELMPRIRRVALVATLMATVTGVALEGLALSAPLLAASPSSLGSADEAVDYVWILVSGFLVMFMQAGFAMVEAGFCRAKNATNLMSKNLIDFVIGTLIFFFVGYALMKGADAGGFIGTSGWMLLGDHYDTGKYLDYFWNLVFCATAATIVSGAVAERLKFRAYLIYSAMVSAVIYPLFGHWMWGGGWLSQLPLGAGAVDFAGSGVVHAVGGLVGLAGAMILGPRFGKYDKAGKPLAIPGHSITLAALGIFILWFGWFGFNAGSTFSAHHLRISVIAVNTNLAAATAVLATLLLSRFRTGKWDVGMALNGALAGLVAITAPCAWVEGWAAVAIGLIAGIIVYYGVKFFDARHIDDPVGAVSVHGLNGLWGLLSVGIFADGTYGVYSTQPPYVTGLAYGGGAEQLLAQLISIVVVAAWSFGLGYLTFKLMDKAFGIRVLPQEELAGLDIPEHGTPAYPDFVTSHR